MDKHELQSARAAEADQLLKSPMFEAAFTDTRQALLNTWAALDTTDERYAEFARDLHRKIKCLDSVRRCLAEHVTTGKLAMREIEAQRRLAPRRVSTN